MEAWQALEGRAVQPQHGCGSDLTGERLAPGKLFAQGLGLQRPPSYLRRTPLSYSVTPLSLGVTDFSALPFPPHPPKTQLQGSALPDLGKNLLFPTYLSPEDQCPFPTLARAQGLLQPPVTLVSGCLFPFSRSSPNSSPTSAETAVWSHGRRWGTHCSWLTGATVVTNHRPNPA